MKRLPLLIITLFTALAYLLKSADTQGFASNYSVMYGALIAIRIIVSNSVQRSSVDIAWNVLAVCIGSILLAYATYSILPTSFITYGRFKANEHEAIPLILFFFITTTLGYIHAMLVSRPWIRLGKEISDLLGPETKKVIRTPVDQQLVMTPEGLYLFLGTTVSIITIIVVSIATLIFQDCPLHQSELFRYTLHEMLALLSYTVIFLHFPYLEEERKPYFMHYVYGLFTALFVVTLYKIL